MQYTKNSWPSSTTKRTPFDLLIGYTPDIHQPTRKTNIPALDKRLGNIEEARKAAQEAQRKVQESWVKDQPHFKPFDIEEQVWLEGTNLKLPANLTSKLSPRRYGPFKVVTIISPVAYQIELPPHWKIHDVFHASLLTPYKETEQHGPNFIELPPDIIEGKPEWEVETILKSQCFGHNKKLQYFVRWKEYSPLHDSWVDESKMHAPDLIKEFYDTHPTTVKSTTIKEPLFLAEDDPSPFQSPLSSCTPSPCPSPLPSQQIAAISLEQSSSLLEQLMELSSFDSIPQTTTSMYSPPSSTESTLTLNSYGPMFSPMQLLATSISATRQLPWQQTHSSPSVTSGRTPITFEWIQCHTVANMEKMKQKTVQPCPTNPPLPTPQKTIPQQPKKQVIPETQKRLQQWKETLRKKMTTTASDTGAPSTI